MLANNGNTARSKGVSSVDMIKSQTIPMPRSFRMEATPDSTTVIIAYQKLPFSDTIVSKSTTNN
jgi:hypothetical protein